MADQGQWFKLWCSADDDPDLSALSLEDFARWVKLGMYIKRHGTSGTVTFRKSAEIQRQKFCVKTDADVISVLKRLPNCSFQEHENSTVTGVTILTVTFTNWHKYQGDNSLERVRRFRARVTPKKRREEKRKNGPALSEPVTDRGVEKCASSNASGSEQPQPEMDLSAEVRQLAAGMAMHRDPDHSPGAQPEKTEEQKSLEGAIYREQLFKVYDDGVLGKLNLWEITAEVVREAAGDLFAKRGFRELNGAGLAAVRETAWLLIRPEIEKMNRIAIAKQRAYLIARAVEVAVLAGQIERGKAGGT